MFKDLKTPNYRDTHIPCFGGVLVADSLLVQTESGDISEPTGEWHLEIKEVK